MAAARTTQPTSWHETSQTKAASQQPERRPRHQLSSREVGQYGKHQGGRGRGAESSADQKEGAQQLSPVLSTCSMSQMPCKVGAAMGPLSQTSLKDRHPGAVPDTSWSCASEAAHTASSQKCSPRISSREGLCFTPFPHTHISQHCSAPPELLHQDKVLLLSYSWKQGALPTTCPRRGLVQRKISEHRAPWTLTTPELTG